MQKNLQDLDAEIKKYGGDKKSDHFKFEKGVNKIRILTFPTIIATHFFGKKVPAVVCVGIDNGCKFHGETAPKDEKTGDPKAPTLKLVSYIIDRKDGKVKLAEMPISIRYGLQNLQNTEGFEFADFPMNYDLQIISDPDNKDPKSKYITTGIPKMFPLTEEEQKSFEELNSKITPEQYVQKRKDKVSANTSNQMPTELGGDIDYPEEEIDPNDIPF